MSGSVWNHIKEDLQSSSKQKLSGLEVLEALLKRTTLGKTEFAELIDLSPSLLSDANSKVTLQALEVLATAVSSVDAPISSYAGALVPFVAERLGDSRQTVREQALNLLTFLFKTLKPELVLDKLAHLWNHKSWKVKQGLLEVLAEAVSGAGASFLGDRDQNNAVLKQVVRMMEEPEMIVREAALGCLAEIHRQAPGAVLSTVQASNLRPAQQKEVLARLGVAYGAADNNGLDVGGKRNHGPMGAFTSDASTACSSGGCYLTPDLTTPVVLDGGSGGGQVAVGDAPSNWATDTRRQTAAAPGPSQPTMSGSVKRGGFKDGGGVTFDGDLPLATPIPITSERDLRMELEVATATLAQAPNADWQARMSAMQRVEGLVLGGAVDWECFHEALKGLAQALSQQFKERRSTIARQACHLIGVLARVLGPRFEPHVLLLLPTLFGVLVITVAVMSESADVGLRDILRHCQTARLLQAISDGVCKEKNPKTRQFCASYIVQILENWDVGVWSRQLESVEAAIRAAAQDSSADTRQLGRNAIALYYGAQPDRAQAFLKRLDSSLQDKLAVGLVGAKPAKSTAITSSRQSLTAAIAAKKLMSRQCDAAADAADASVQACVATSRRPRTSVVPSDLPQRIPLPVTPAVRHVVESSAAIRLPVTQTPEQPPNRGSAVPAASGLLHARSAASSQQDRAVVSTDSGSAAGSGGLFPLTRTVSSILAGLRTWSDKVDALSSLSTHLLASTPNGAVAPGGNFDVTSLQQAGLVAEPEKVLQALVRLRDIIMETLEDPHQKVLEAALLLMRLVVLHYGRVMEGQLDRLLPLLLNKGGENKEPARALCCDVLDECGRSYRPEILVPALAKCLDVVKLPRGKQTTLEFFKAHLDQWGAINPTHLKHWLLRLAPLLDDRHPELRKRAADVLDALLATAWAREPITHLAYQHNSPEVAPLRRYLAGLQLGGPSSHLTGGSWSDSGVGTVQLQHVGATGMAVYGAPISTANDPRLQAPSAAVAAPVRQPVPQQQLAPTLGSSYERGQSILPWSESSSAARQTWPGSPSQLPATSSSVTGYRVAAAAGAQPAQRGQVQPSTLCARPLIAAGQGPIASAASLPGTAFICSTTQYVHPGSPSPGPRRTLQVPNDLNVQLAFLARMVDAARAAVSNGQGQSGGTTPAVSKDQQVAAMEDLADAIQQCSKDVWVRTFPLLMVEISSWIQQPTCGVRTWAFWLLKELLLRQPHLFTDNNLESQLNLLLQGCGDLHRDVVMTAGQALQILLSICNERHAIVLLQQLLQRERESHLRTRDKGARVVAVLDGTRQMITRLERSELQRIAFQPQPETRITLLEALVSNLSDPETCVRRSAVLTSAGIWHRLGHAVRDVLQVLAAQSFNLLCIYYLKLHGVVVDAGQQDVSQHPLIQGGNSVRE
ncbi:hypothetical protein VaNZ11_001093 [Volvox africanus]|uniref:TOG domain-containing protein n=1 Tax=Volvox africanus TaxID=51714 RepID=A0ABQ5RNW5_9CHLO|nr:hypothetical protein VaNZ11_001093 [Volvox africanus]